MRERPGRIFRLPFDDWVSICLLLAIAWHSLDSIPKRSAKLKTKDLKNTSSIATNLSQPTGVTTKEELRFRKKIALSDLVQILKQEGYPVLRHNPEKPILFRSAGHGIFLQLYADGDLQILAVFQGYDVNLGRLNRWNKENRLSRAYLGNNGEVVLTADLLSNGGLNYAKIRDFVNLFSIQAGRFQSYLDNHQDS